MKKIISIFTIITIIAISICSTNVFAAALDDIDVKVSKTTVRPEEEVKLTVEFGQSLGAYTFDVSYDNQIFDYVSAEGGTANDTGDKVKVVFHDTTGGTNPRTNMSVTFKAKEGITTSNPTELTVTAEGLANADASVTYDDITTPIVKNITVEPEYVDYKLKLEYTGEIVKDVEKDMTLSYSSSMGRYYAHARLVAEATTPEGGTVKLLATDKARLEHDIIQSGWGDAQGYAIGGKDVSQVLQTKGIFSKEGQYNITLKLIDRDNSDQTIAEQSFKFDVKETATPITPEVPEEKPEEPKPEEPKPEETPKDEVEKETPKELPKTGNNIYVPVVAFAVMLISAYAVLNKRKK